MLDNAGINLLLEVVSVFEGGVPKRYSTFSCMKGDAGELSLGYLQASLTSGSVGKLLRTYANLGGKVIPESYIHRAESIDHTLDTDATLKPLWLQACADPLMHTAQDLFFSEYFIHPAMADADKLNVSEPLCYCLAVDGHIQGAFHTINAMLPAGLNQWDWAKSYVKTRRNWLATHKIQALHATVYRMDFFQEQIDAGNWKLDARPMDCHGYKFV